jgi:hypothetical protein
MDNWEKASIRIGEIPYARARGQSEVVCLLRSAALALRLMVFPGKKLFTIQHEAFLEARSEPECFALSLETGRHVITPPALCSVTTEEGRSCSHAMHKRENIGVYPILYIGHASVP